MLNFEGLPSCWCIVHQVQFEKNNTRDITGKVMQWLQARVCDLMSEGTREVELRFEWCYQSTGHNASPLQGPINPCLKTIGILQTSCFLSNIFKSQVGDFDFNLSYPIPAKVEKHHSLLLTEEVRQTLCPGQLPRPSAPSHFSCQSLKFTFNTFNIISKGSDEFRILKNILPTEKTDYSLFLIKREKYYIINSTKSSATITSLAF